MNNRTPVKVYLDTSVKYDGILEMVVCREAAVAQVSAQATGVGAAKAAKTDAAKFGKVNGERAWIAFNR